MTEPNPSYCELEPDLLDYVEQEAKLNFADRVDAMKDTREQLNLLIALQLSGGGGALALALATDVSTLRIGAFLAVAVWLFALATVLTWIALLTVAYPTAGGHPADLLRFQEDNDLSTSQLRHSMLRGLDRRLVDVVTINRQRAAWLNWFRLGTCATPLVAGLGALIATTIGG